MARGTGGRGQGRGRGRGRGRVPVCESAAGPAPGAAQEHAADSQARQEGPVGGGAAGPQAGAAADGLHDRVDRMEGMFSRLMEQLAGRPPAQGQAPVGQGAAGVQPGMAGVQPDVAVAERLSAYLRMLEQMQRIGTGSFLGGARAEEADLWRSRLERNFRSLRCPEEYKVDLAIHYLEGDAYLWWRGVTGRRAQASMVYADFLAEFNAKYYPQEAVDRLVSQFVELEQGDRSVREYDEEFGRLLVHAGRDYESEESQMRRFMRGLRPDLTTRCRTSRCATRAELAGMAAAVEEDLRAEQAVVASPPVQQQRRPQQQGGLSAGSKPAQGQKRKWEGTSGASKGGQRGPGCFRCGSMDHKIASCPKREETSASQVSRGGQGCFECGSMDHRVASCPRRGQTRDTRVCYHCKEPGHIKPRCPKLQQGIVAVVQPSQMSAAVVQPLQQIAAPRVYTSVETGGSSARPITGTYLILTW